MAQYKRDICKFPDERKRLLRLVKRDQSIRLDGDFSLPQTELRMHYIDYANQTELRKILNIIEFPTVDNVGQDGAEAVWLIAQHALHNRELQEAVLDKLLVSTKLDKHSVYRRGIPYLMDRVRISKGLPQIYGTQVWSGDCNSKPQLYPILNISRVNNHRKKYGLSSLDEYVERLGIIYPD